MVCIGVQFFINGIAMIFSDPTFYGAGQAVENYAKTTWNNQCFHCERSDSTCLNTEAFRDAP
jgi:hypothetical protein